MKRAPAAIVFIMLSSALANAAGESAAALYNHGNKLYATGEFEKALAAYEDSWAAGGRDSRLFANLGDAAYRAGKIGVAVWAFKSGIALSPRDEDLAFNYRFAKAHTIDQLPDSADLFVTRVWKGLLASFTASEWAGAWLALLLTSSAFCSLTIVSRSGGRFRAALVWALIIAGSLLILISIPFAARINNFFSEKEAVFISPEVKARSTPSQDGPVVFMAHEGMELTIVETRGAYSQIRIPTGYAGWAPVNSYRIVEK